MVTLHLDERVHADASLDDVEAAVHDLDGADRTLVLVELPSGKCFTIGGGPDCFIAELAEDDVHRWAIVDPARGNAPIDLVVGGQLVGYPARLCVSRERVLAAVRTFVLENGARSPAVEWSVES